MVEIFFNIIESMFIKEEDDCSQEINDMISEGSPSHEENEE